MRPWHHAKSSAGKMGDWVADLAIHEFMDSTKVACPDLRHRMVLHNADLGPELAARAFPDRPEAKSIALRHVDEDMGCTPTIAEWLAGCDPARLPHPLFRRLPLLFEELPAMVAQAQGLRDDDGPRSVLDLLLLPVRLAGPNALSVLFNGAGLAIVRGVIGMPRIAPSRDGGQTVFDPAHAAEAIIHWVFGRIPSLAEVVFAVRQKPYAEQEAWR